MAMNANAPEQNMMKHADFSIGKAFRCGDKRWRCTDVGARVIVAICLDCEFRRKPAGDSDLIPAGVPI